MPKNQDQGGRDPKEKKAMAAAHDDVHESLQDMQKRVGEMQSLLDLALKNSGELGKSLAKDNQADQEKRWKIMQDTQTKIFSIQQDITNNKAKTADKAFKAMDEYIRN